MSSVVDTAVRPWMKSTLAAAGIYNIAWGTVIVLFPDLMFDLGGLQRPLYPSIWQGVGMLVGVYGVGYLVASPSPLRHWPITLVGLLGKILGPIGFLGLAVTGQLPWSFGWAVIANDVLWWIPFAGILFAAARDHQADLDTPPLEQTEAFSRRSVAGRSLVELSDQRPQLVLFLRHLGCTFCKEALADLRAQRASIEASGTGLAVVHMGTPDEGRELLRHYGLEQIEQFSDPDRQLYRAFDLGRGTASQLLGPGVWWRGLRAVLSGHRVGRLVGDGFQMPGVFLVADGKITQAYRHRTSGDRPDYTDLATSVSSSAPPLLR